MKSDKKHDLFYMIVFEKALSEEHENLLKILYWDHDVLDAVAVAMDATNSDLSVITHNPFKNRTIHLRDNSNKRETLFAEKNLNLFGSRFNVVMHKNKVTAPNNPAVSKPINLNYDAFLPDLISLLLNATLILKTPNLDDADFLDIKNADLIVNANTYPLSFLKPLGLEKTITLRRNDICVLVPYNRQRNTFAHLYKIVSPYVWALMFVVIILTWLSFYTTKWVQPHKMWNRSFLLDVFAFHMNQPLKKMPKILAHRMIVASCLLYCVVITSIFIGSLFTSMSIFKDTKISTLDELLELNQHELLISNKFYTYAENYLTNFPINNHLQMVNSSVLRRRIESNQKDYAYVFRKRTANYFENTQIVNRQPVYYTMEDCIVPLMTLYFVRVGSPFLNRINFLLRSIEESGIFRYNEDQLKLAYYKLNQGQRLFINQEPEELAHLDFVFQIWGYGLVSATAIFIIEQYAMRLKKWFRIKWYHK